MNGGYCKLIIVVTIKMPYGGADITMRTSRTLPFPPMEGMTLVLANDEQEQYELLLGPPRYEFSESAFVEYQEESFLLDRLAEESHSLTEVADLIKFYESFSFQRFFIRD